jgi:chromosomal replication initiation ATPase DnaA
MTTHTSNAPESQLPLDLPVEAAQERDDLIVTRANSMAVEMIDNWPNWPGPLVVLAGPPGSGKSHIASVWSAMSGAHVIDMASLDASAPPQGVNIVIEDASVGAVPEEALFHILNHVRAEGGHCIITSREWPIAWGVKLPDLASRLRASQLVELAEPDDALLCAVMVKLFADRQVVAPPHVISWLAARMERSLDAARTIVAEIDREALARGVRISRVIAADVLRARGSLAD